MPTYVSLLIMLLLMKWREIGISIFIVENGIFFTTILMPITQVTGIWPILLIYLPSFSF